MTHYAETDYGFEYGAAEIIRVCSDDKNGWIVLQVKTPKARLQVYVTKTGKMTLYGKGFTVKEQQQPASDGGEYRCPHCGSDNPGTEPECPECGR